MKNVLGNYLDNNLKEQFLFEQRHEDLQKHYRIFYEIYDYLLYTPSPLILMSPLQSQLDLKEYYLGKVLYYFLMLNLIYHRLN